MGLTSQEVAAFEDYFYHIMAARGSGEHALRHLLAPFARAKHPLEGRLHELKVVPASHLLLFWAMTQVVRTAASHNLQTPPGIVLAHSDALQLTLACFPIVVSVRHSTCKLHPSA